MLFAFFNQNFIFFQNMEVEKELLILGTYDTSEFKTRKTAVTLRHLGRRFFA